MAAAFTGLSVVRVLTVSRVSEVESLTVKSFEAERQNSLSSVIFRSVIALLCTCSLFRSCTLFALLSAR